MSQPPYVSATLGLYEPIPPPPVSPITPVLPTAHLPDATPQQPLPSPVTRPILTHAHQPDQVAVPPPPPRLIDFDSNPDVLALKSAISVLQMQKKKATADIQLLSRTRDAAIADPFTFVQDLVAGKVDVSPEPVRHGDKEEDGLRPPEWAALPKPQDVIRCPPINWAQYAVVGPSFDKLHAEEVAQPTQGTPATVGVNGTYEFQEDGKRVKYLGVAAPYTPGKDCLEPKPV